jgi:hypothetical protein
MEEQKSIKSNDIKSFELISTKSKSSSQLSLNAYIADALASSHFSTKVVKKLIEYQVSSMITKISH